jgi:hypothetical protein
MCFIAFGRLFVCYLFCKYSRPWSDRTIPITVLLELLSDTILLVKDLFWKHLWYVLSMFLLICFSSASIAVTRWNYCCIFWYWTYQLKSSPYAQIIQIMVVISRIDWIPTLASMSTPERGITPLIIDDLCYRWPLAFRNVLSTDTM